MRAECQDYDTHTDDEWTDRTLCHETQTMTYMNWLYVHDQSAARKDLPSPNSNHMLIVLNNVYHCLIKLIMHARLTQKGLRGLKNDYCGWKLCKICPFSES